MDDRYERGNAHSELEAAVESFCDYAQLSQKIRDYLSDEVKLYEGRNWSYQEIHAYLSEMYAWECAPILSVKERLPLNFKIVDVRTLSDQEVAAALQALIAELRCLRQEILYADHLSDRRLYNLIVKYVLPHESKALQIVKSPNYWNFCSFTETEDYDSDEEDDAPWDNTTCMREQNWLAYYASDLERRRWKQENHREPPEKKQCLHVRSYLYNNVSFH